MVADFEDYGELHGGVTAASIRGAADDPNAHTATVQALISDLADDDAAISSNVEGDIDDATRMNLNPADGAARRLAQNGMYAIGLLNSFADTVQTFDTAVDAINSDLHTMTGQRLSAQAHRPETDGDGDGGDRLTYDEIKAQVKAELKPRYDAAVNTLEDEADAVAGKFESGPTLADVKALVLAGYIALEHAGLWPNLQLTDDERKTAQVNTVKNMTTAEQVAYVRNTKDIDPAIASVINPEAQQILADDVSDAIKDKKVDDETVRIMQLLQDQQPFAHRVFTTVTPDQITDVIQKFSNETFPPGVNPPYDQAERAQLYQDFLNASGHTFATFTKGEGAYRPPSDLADTWYQAITDEQHPANATALTMLIKHGGHETSFDPDFLGDLTNKVYDWEKSHDGSPVWGPLNEQLGEGYGIKDPSIEYGDDDSDSWDDHATYQTPYDGLANLLSGMEKTPEAAENFFDDPDTTKYHDQDVNEKLHYLLSERRWPTDDGDGLGIALEGATLHSRDGGDGNPATLSDGEKAARLASQTMFVIGHEVGRGDSWRPGDDGWQVPTGMTDSVGKIVGGYMPDLYRISQGNGEDITGGDWIWGDSDGEDRANGTPVGLLASNDDMAKVLQSIGRGDDKTGMQYVTTSALEYHNTLNGQAIDDARMPDGSKPQSIADLRNSNFESLMNDEAARGGKTLSFVMQNGFLGGKADEAASQEERDAIAKAFGAATEFVPTPQGKIAGFLTSEGLSMIGDKLGEQPDSVTDQWAKDSDQAVKDSLNFQTYNQLLNHGFLGPNDPDGLPASAVKTDENGHRYIDPHLYNGDNDDVDPVAQREFNAWLASKGYSGPGQSAINAYSSNLPNFD